MSQTLVVYEEIPESLSMYIIDNDEIDEERRELLEQCNGKYSDSSESTEDDEEILAELREILDMYEPEPDPIHEVNITHVYHTGIVL